MNVKEMQEYVRFLPELSIAQLSDERVRLYSVQSDAATRITLVATVQNAYNEAKKDEATA